MSELEGPEMSYEFMGGSSLNESLGTRMKILVYEGNRDRKKYLSFIYAKIHTISPMRL